MKKIKLLALLSVLISSTMYSDIKLDSSKLQNTTIEQGKKGNTIINISTPNGKGISVNDFENFQTKNGVIFNNSGQRMNISQLEGVINRNPNITRDQAKLILNRVNGTNRTEIEGAMEAVGRNKVDMIFSSPNGIYLDGAKFTGFKDVTFTTAPVNLDGEGNIQTLTIDKGSIEIGRKGLDASKLEQLALLSKQISIDGEVKGKNLNFIAGDFDYDVNDKSQIYKEVKNDNISISSSEFGSIYGDQINIIAKNGEIGIKGDIMTTNNILLDSKKNIKVYGNMNAEQKIHIMYGNKLEINSNLESENDMIFDKYFYGSDTLINANANVLAKTIIFKNMNREISAPREGTIINLGTMVSSEKFILDTYLHNEGTIFTNDFYIGYFSAFSNYFCLNNNGEVMVLNNMIGDRGARLASDNIYFGEKKKDSKTTILGDAKLTTLWNRGNNAEMDIKGNLEVQHLWDFNNGKTTIDGNALVTVEFYSARNSIFNIGNLKVNGAFFNFGVLNTNNFYSERDNRYIANWENRGIMNVKENINIIRTGDPNRKNGEILNSGEINTNKINVSAFIVENKGVINAQESIEIISKKIHNEGELNTKNLKLAFKDFSSQGGKITADKISFENYPE